MSRSRAPDDSPDSAPPEPVEGSAPTKDPSPPEVTGSIPVLAPSGAPVAAVGSDPREGPGEGGAAFPAGSLVSDRYRIVQFIARGAMGEVYEARDEMLHGTVALKTIRPAIAADARAVERFKREIQLARQVTHANVCRIFDIGVHHAADRPLVLFLTMELLKGETLHSRVHRVARMTTDEALPLIRQMAAGLDAAHEHGIIHRDFKSGNVVIVPSSKGRRGERAVITDFGLARSSSAEGGDSLASLSDSGLLVGTPAYMAPEQVRGDALSSAADLYAFGIVIYEMVTGRRPFDGGSGMTVAVRRLTEDPPPPHLVVADLDPRWEAAILRCLARDPLQRFARAGDVVDALRSGLPGRVEPPPSSGSEQTRAIDVSGTSAGRPRWPLVAGAGAAVALVLAALGQGRQTHTASPPPATASTAPAAVKPRKSVAVLGFHNTSGRPEAAWLSSAISEILSTELAAGNVLRVASAEEVARVRQELGVADLSNVSREDAQRLARNLGANTLVVGSYTGLDAKESRLLRVELRLLDGRTGETVTSAPASGTEVQLFDLVTRGGAVLRRHLGVGEVSAAEAVQIEATVPANPRAARLYAEGLAALRMSDGRTAKDLLTQAVDADPKHPLLRAALSSAWSLLGHEVKAREEASKAVAGMSSLPASEQLRIEGRAHEAAKDWAKAAETYGRAFQAAPDDLEVGLRLASTQTRAGQAREALATFEALRRLPAPLADDPRIDLEEARARLIAGDVPKAHALSVAAARKAEKQGTGLVVARARLIEGRASKQQGENDEALAAIESARALFEAGGDKEGLARTLEELAEVVHGRGDLEGWGRLLDRALAVHREIGDEMAVARVLNNQGAQRFAQGRLAEADALFEKALATFRQVGARYEAAAALGAIGARLQNSGDLAGAQKRYEHALALYGELDNKEGTALTLTNIAEILYTRGVLDQSRKLHEESLAINREIGEKGGAAYDLYRLGEVFAAKGDLLVAKQRYEDALRIQREIGDTLGAADTQLALGSVALAEGRLAEAETLAREAEQVLRTEGATDHEGLAHVLLARILGAAGRKPEAAEAVRRAREIATKSEDRQVQLSSAILDARHRGASDPAGAIGALKALETSATRAGFTAFVYEARLAMAEVEMASGKKAAAAARLQEIAKAARAQGFGQVARRADALGG